MDIIGIDGHVLGQILIAFLFSDIWSVNNVIRIGKRHSCLIGKNIFPVDTSDNQKRK